MSQPRTLLCWSTGKDSAWCLHTLRNTGSAEYGEVVGLLTTYNESADRVVMHAVRRELLVAQAAVAGLPLVAVPLPAPCSNEAYGAVMRNALATARQKWGVTQVAFGDLFLEDIRAYRERQMAETGLTPIFPLWGKPTAELAAEMLASGLQAYVTCVDPRCMPENMVGRPYDREFLNTLPPGVDPCGERGEFHTFTWAGPMFSQPIPVQPGEIVSRDGFLFADLLPANPG